jgi:hypothetical protein
VFRQRGLFRASKTSELGIVVLMRCVRAVKDVQLELIA